MLFKLRPPILFFTFSFSRTTDSLVKRIPVRKESLLNKKFLTEKALVGRLLLEVAKEKAKCSNSCQFLVLSLWYNSLQIVRISNSLHGCFLPRESFTKTMNCIVWSIHSHCYDSTAPIRLSALAPEDETDHQTQCNNFREQPSSQLQIQECSS